MGDPGDQAASRVSPVSGMSIKNHQEAEVVPLATVGSVEESSLEMFVFGKALGGECRRTWVPCGSRQEVTTKSQASGIMSWRNPGVGRSVVACPMRKTV